MWKFDDTSDSAPGGTRPPTLKDGAVLAGGALELETDPSDNRAAASAFNPTSSFSIFLDSQAVSLPSGPDDPHYILLSNVGDDSVRTFAQFSTSAGYMVFLRPDRIDTFQQTGGGFAGARGAALQLPDPTGRHAVVVHREFDSVVNQFRSMLFLDGSSSSATPAFGAMDFTTGTSTTDLLLGICCWGPTSTGPSRLHARWAAGSSRLPSSTGR